MAESFGARLRQQRERRQIPLAAISTQTRISLSLLEGLERDDVSHWPTGIFRRSFIRAYAQIIGLEPDSVVREFLERFPDPVDVFAAAELGADRESERQRPPTRLRWLLAEAMNVLSRNQPQVALKREPTNGDLTPTDRGSPPPASEPEPDLATAAHLCTELGRIRELREAAPLLENAARVLDAVGLIVWIWDSQAKALRPALACGYSNSVLENLPKVRRDEDNATAASFRSAQPHIVKTSARGNGAIVVPLMTSTGCVGVLAVELRRGGEQRQSVCALATIFAAQLAALGGPVPLAEAVNA